MTVKEAISILKNAAFLSTKTSFQGIEEAVDMAIEALKAQEVKTDMISRQDAIDAIFSEPLYKSGMKKRDVDVVVPAICEKIKSLPSAQSEQTKYEYHYDHTDCIWYRPEARNRCPTTCAQYRDGWNDAMNYIFRDGKGYRPYRRDEKYE